MPRAKKAEPKLRCMYCKHEVYELAGRAVIGGKYAAYRHVVNPRSKEAYCAHGDPLLNDEAVTE